MNSEVITSALINARCPYCVVGLEFNPMQRLDGGGFICQHCGHTAKPCQQQFRCSCPHCTCAAGEIAFLVATATSHGATENPRETEILHSLNLLTFEEALLNCEMDNGELEIKREVEIKKELVALYEQQKTFPHPTPAERPPTTNPKNWKPGPT